tara:strand:+ start:8690 stop:9343 length:654 start_codon:yes stop_codon:yes gene_type:complete
MQTQIWLWGPQFAPLLPQALLELAKHEGPLQHIAVDAGVFVKDQLPKSHQAHFVAIGDGDSSSPELMTQLHPKDKNLSDLSLALQFIDKSSNSSQSIRALGFSGGRLDHHMIAQGCFSRFLSLNRGMQIRLDGHWLLLSQGEWSGQLDPSVVSILTYAETEIELTGDWRWCLNKSKVAVLDDRLLSNECGGERVALSCSAPIALYSETTLTKWWNRD